MPRFHNRSGLAHPPALTNAARSRGKAALGGPAYRGDAALTGFRCRLSLTETKPRAKEIAMKWKKPVIIEIAVGLEINAYACAEVK
jgi:coenzyme PQQ precursor peptide PqqA